MFFELLFLLFLFNYFYFIFIFLGGGGGGGSTFGLMLIGWRAANMSSMSSGEERNVVE